MGKVVGWPGLPGLVSMCVNTCWETITMVLENNHVKAGVNFGHPFTVEHGGGCIGDGLLDSRRKSGGRNEGLSS